MDAHSRALPNHDFFLVRVRPLSRLLCKAFRAGEGDIVSLSGCGAMLSV